MIENERIKTTPIIYLCALAVNTLAFVLIYKLELINAVGMITCIEGSIIGCIPTAVLSTYGLRSGLDKFELWARRICILILNIFGYSAGFTVVGAYQSSSILPATLLGFGMALVVVVPIYIIIDRREKKKLEEINKKLREQKDND